MENFRTRLLTITPLIMSAVTGTAFAQEAPVAALNAQVASAALRQADAAGLTMNVNIPVESTYVFSAPANSGIKLRVDGNVILDLSSANASGSSEAVKALTTLTVGMHRIDVLGDDVTPQDVAAITLNQVGMPATSLTSVTDAVSDAGASSVMRSADRRVLTSAAPASAMSRQSADANESASRQVFNMGSRNETTRAARGVLVGTAYVSSGGGIRPTVGGSGGGMGPDGTQREEPDGVARSAVRNAISAILASRGGSNPGPVIAPGAAISSPLSPPTGVALTQAVEIVGGATDEGVVSASGQTLFGGVMDPQTYDIVEVSFSTSDRVATVDVGPTTGQFAVRLFPEDLEDGSVTVTLMGASSSNDNVMTAPVSFDFTAAPNHDGLTQALSRITYGPTADLYSRVRSIGFENYVNEQLNPQNIRNAAFESMDFDDILEETTTNTGAMFRSLMRHNLAHAAFTERQLQEVMGEFWSNHFHATTKDSGVTHQNIEDREFFRDNAMGRFEDLLLYSARSPLMSQFLDNDQSRVGRLNENYGREIMELHTVGVDAGYGEEDVIAVSRIFTGWNYRQTNAGAEGVARLYEFEFRAGNHDTDDKVIPFLNTTIAGRSGAAGVQEGEELIALLAADPRTHNYVCGKIVQHFVADVPPAEFVDLCVAAWQASDGSSREILRAILTAPAFIENVELQRNKGKTPFEFAASTIRAIGASPDSNDEEGDFFDEFRNASERAGYAPLSFTIPTGLPEVGSAWINSASMIAQYRDITEVVERPGEYNIDFAGQIDDAGLETAEEVAAYMLTVATADRYRLDEFDAMVQVLKGQDGIFEPAMRDESAAFNRAAGLLITLPSFKLQ